MRAAFGALLHLQPGAERPWRLLPLVLALAFAVRAAVALAGDFVLHPDEIMQYLEPAHRLAFGNGIVYWEYFYGARSWLVPGAVAGILRLFDAVGLGQPWWYVDGVKLAFCALSLAIPAGMYLFARRHFDEATARIALVAGAFWYELAAFAHKPLTELVAAAPLMGLLALCVHPAPNRPRVVAQAAALAVLAAAVRLQYAPVALLLLGIVFLRTRLKLLLVLAAAAASGAVGVFDALAWDGGLFHSYVTNVRFNLILGGMRTGESPAYQFLWWLTLAGGGLSVLSLAGSLRSPRRYALLLGLIALVLLSHSLQSHKEYRFVFAVIPLWLLIGADLVVRVQRWASGRLAAGGDAGRRTLGAAAAVRGGVAVHGGVAGRRAECAAVPAAGVPGVVAGVRRDRLRARHGPDLRGLSTSGPNAGRRRGMARRPALLQPARLLLPAPRGAVLRRVHGPRDRPRCGDDPCVGQPRGVSRPGADRCGVYAGAGHRRHTHPAPGRGATAGPPVAGAHADHRRRPRAADHAAGGRGLPGTAGRRRHRLRRTTVTTSNEAVGSRPAVSVVVPTLREAANIPILAERIRAALSRTGLQWDLLLVDDDSRDGSEQIVAELARRLPVRIEVRRNAPRDLSLAVLHGIRLARFDRVVVMDADLSHPPERIVDLLTALDGECDMAVGSRYVPGGHVDRTWGWGRRLNSRVATLLARPLVRCSDPMAGFFAADRRALPDLQRLQPIGYKIGLELMVRGRLRVTEVPIDFVDRDLGASKMDWRQQVNYLRHLYRLYRYRHGAAARLASFALVGASGFVVDVAVYLGLQAIGVEHRVARFLAFWPAVSWNWLVNRALTFEERARQPRMRQWTKFVASSLIGLGINVGSYALLTSFVDLFARHRLAALVCGVALGGVANFLVANRYVYRRNPEA